MADFFGDIRCPAKEFYSDYVKLFPRWQPDDAKAVSYEDFLNARPLFSWRDDFGRFIRFVNTQFVVPKTCEPILYLYPKQKENIEVKLGRTSLSSIRTRPIAMAGSFPRNLTAS